MCHSYKFNPFLNGQNSKTKSSNVLNTSTKTMLEKARMMPATKGLEAQPYWRRRREVLRESWQSMKCMDRSFQGTVRVGSGERAAGRACRKWENWYSPKGNKIPVSQKEEQAGKQVGAWEMSCMLREDEWLSCIQPISLTDGANWSAAPLTKHATTWWEITLCSPGPQRFPVVLAGGSAPHYRTEAKTSSYHDALLTNHDLERTFEVPSQTQCTT